jgi:uncharacterized protein YlxW (UPF0749 family)
MEAVMTDSQISQREYGQLEAHVAQLRDDVRHLQSTMNQMSQMMQQAQGGWRVLAGVSGLSGTVGAGVVWILQHIPWRG